MPHRAIPDWDEIGKRGQRLRDDVSSMANVGFAEIATGLEELVRQEVDALGYSEIFVARLPASPSISRGVAEQRRRTQLLLHAHRYFVAMTPHEASIVWMIEAAR